MTAYEVTGSRPYLGHKPGEVFEAELDENQERRAIEGGAIKKTQRKPTTEQENEDA